MPGSQASFDDLTSLSSFDSDDEEYRLAEQEWRESLQQIQLLVSVVIMPFFGKYMGRRWSQWAYARYLRVGLGKSFFWS